MYVKDRPKAYFTVRWQTAEASKLGLEVGQSSSQTAFECLALLFAVMLWARPSQATLLLGDNLGALQECLAVRGRGQQLRIAQQLAVLRARRTLRLWVAHLPNEANTVADALSRLDAPEGHQKQLPAELAKARPCEPPSLADFEHFVLIAS